MSRKFLLLFLAIWVLIDVPSRYIAGRMGRDAPLFHATMIIGGWMASQD